MMKLSRMSVSEGMRTRVPTWGLLSTRPSASSRRIASENREDAGPELFRQPPTGQNCAEAEFAPQDLFSNDCISSVGEPLLDKSPRGLHP